MGTCPAPSGGAFASMAAIFFTGFPGFLGSELLPRVLERSPDDRAVCLVQQRWARLAAERAAELEAEHPALAGRVELVEGDITRSGLGLDGGRARRRDVSRIFHLAAVYDLAVPRRLGLEINLEGTRQVLEFAAGCPRLERFDYVSTCYVSGRWAGIFTEDDLDRGQSFNNYYEETKFLAEVAVQGAMGDGLPATVYRPAIVVGDSRTGATRKFDGPYFVMQWILRQPGLGVMPVVGDPQAVRVNLVPSDFVVAALAHLSSLDRSRGRVYQLCDPEPLTVDELIDAIAGATGRRLLRLPLMRGPSKAALRFVPGVHRLLKMPAEAIDYFVHPTHYTCDHTLADLAGSGIEVPPLPSYLDRLIDYLREHPEAGRRPMI